MRPLRLLLCGALLFQAWGPAWAARAAARPAVRAPGAARPALPHLPHMPALPKPALPAAAPVSAEFAVPAAAAALPARLSALQAAVARDGEALAAAAGESLAGGSRESFSRLLGERAIAVDGEPLPALPSAALPSDPPHAPLVARGPPAPAKGAAAEPGKVRQYLLGTGVFKIGMESLSLSIPLIALTVFGQVKWAAVLALGWGLSQVVFGSLAGGLLDRRSPSRVLSWAMGLQGAAVAGLISLFALGLAHPVAVLALYSLAGGFMGAADTARQVIPPTLSAPGQAALKVFNAKVHVAYEIAGVAGAAATGVIIASFGLVPALLLHPPAYLLAAFLFARLKLPAPSVSAQAAEPASLGRALSDLREGARAVLAKPAFRWAALALVVPLVLHRLLESLLIPVAAKTLLGDPSAAAWIVSASNLGELLGALLLLRAFRKGGGERFPPSFWVSVMAVGTLGILSLSLAPTLWVILPLIMLRSLSWAASDLSLRSKLQDGLPPSLRGRAFAFIGALAFLSIIGASLGLSALFDAFGTLPVFFGVDAVLVAAVIALWFAARRLKGG